MKHSRPPVGPVLLLLVLVLASCGGGGSKAVPPGSVTVLAQTCPGGTGNLPNTTCQLLRVEGLGNAPIEVELRVTEPAGVPLLGTVLLGSGDGGTEFYADIAGGELLIGDLVALGFRVADRRWQRDWFGSGNSIKTQAGRYATLLKWVHDHVHTTGVFCASGNSGGSAEIAYALSSWNADPLLDFAVLSSGPPLARLDWLCESPPPPTWAGICGSIVPPGVMECGTPSCVATDQILLFCQFLPPNPAAGQLQADSILHPGALLDYGTPLHIVLGAADCTSTIPLGLYYQSQVTSTATLEFVPGGQHVMPATQAGRDAISGALLAAASGPAPSLLPLPRLRAHRAVLLRGGRVESARGLVIERVPPAPGD